MGVKEALRGLVGGYSQEEDRPLPEEMPDLRNRSESIEVNYDSPGIVSVPAKITEETFTLEVEEEYSIKMGVELNNLLDEPSL